MSSLLNAPRELSLAVHEFRTPVTVVSGYVRMLLREQAGAVTEPQRTMLEEAERSCARIGALITEMGELAQLNTGEVNVPDVPFDLAALVVELAAGLPERDDRGVRLDVRADAPVMVTGDRPRLAAALRGLMRAALRERSEPGVIVVACSTLEQPPERWALVTIGDDAVTPSLVEGARAPVPPAFDQWRGGHGLTLPIGRCVIEAHGGALWSAPGSRGASALRLRATR
jgi:signal transduction histidine kinase